MAVTPLNRRKIVKKVTKTPNRFQSHLYMRVSVSSITIIILTFFAFLRPPIEEWEVLIARPEEDGEVCRKKWKSVTSKRRRPDTSLPTDSRSSSSPAKVISICSSWTTEFTAEKSLKTFPSQRGKSLHLIQRVSHLEWDRAVCVFSSSKFREGGWNSAQVTNFQYTYHVFQSSYRLRIVQRAKEMNVKLTNGAAKAKKESTEWSWWKLLWFFICTTLRCLSTLALPLSRRFDCHRGSVLADLSRRIV